MTAAIRIGTRGSRLALAQAAEIKKRLERLCPKHNFKLVVIKTSGDEFQTVALFKKTNIGVFTKALETKLLKKEIDIAVHSLKDLPTELPKGLVLAAFPKRLDPSDVLISRKRFSLKSLPKGAVVGTSSPRRKCQLHRIRPDLILRDIRGNLDTRVSKVLREKKYEPIILARAGLLRLKKYLRYASPISPKQLLPAVGQAALGLEARRNDRLILGMLKRLNHPPTEKEVRAERTFLKTLHGGCRVPVGVYSKIHGHRITLHGAVFSVRNNRVLKETLTASKNNYQKVGESLAQKLLRKGADSLLIEARND